MTKQIEIWARGLKSVVNIGFHRCIQIALLSALVFRFQSTGRAQTYVYQITAPINGWFQQGAADPGNDWRGVGYIFDFGTLSETVCYNSSANTLQQIGSITLGSTGFSGSFEDDKDVGGNLVQGTVSVAYTLNNGSDIVMFNSGVHTVGANQTMNWSIPFSETITLTTGGQVYSGTIAGTIPEANDVTSISQFTPDSIVLSQGYQNLSMDIGSQYSLYFDASDGWAGSIVDGIGDGSLSYYYFVSPTKAFAVPEPDGVIFVLGTLAIELLVNRIRR